MLKGLKRKLVILSVLVVAFTAVPAAPVRAQDGPVCVLCVCDFGRCFCYRTKCPE
jgi:hypothetical protein